MMQISHIREWRPRNLTGENPVESENIHTERHDPCSTEERTKVWNDISQEHLLPQTSIVIKVEMYIANSWVLLIDQTGIKKSKVNFIAFMNLHCLYVVIVMMHWYECIYSNCHVKAVQIPWKQWSLLQKSFSSLFDNQEYSRISHIHWYLDDNWYPE